MHTLLRQGGIECEPSVDCVRHLFDEEVVFLVLSELHRDY